MTDFVGTLRCIYLLGSLRIDYYYDYVSRFCLLYTRDNRANASSFTGEEDWSQVAWPLTITSISLPYQTSRTTLTATVTDNNQQSCTWRIIIPRA